MIPVGRFSLGTRFDVPKKRASTSRFCNLMLKVHLFVPSFLSSSKKKMRRGLTFVAFDLLVGSCSLISSAVKLVGEFRPSVPVALEEERLWRVGRKSQPIIT
jgi:hypothetical protein